MKIKSMSYLRPERATLLRDPYDACAFGCDTTRSARHSYSDITNPANDNNGNTAPHNAPHLTCTWLREKQAVIIVFLSVSFSERDYHFVAYILVLCLGLCSSATVVVCCCGGLRNYYHRPISICGEEEGRQVIAAKIKL